MLATSTKGKQPTAATGLAERGMKHSEVVQKSQNGGGKLRFINTVRTLKKQSRGTPLKQVKEETDVFAAGIENALRTNRSSKINLALFSPTAGHWAPSNHHIC